MCRFLRYATRWVLALVLTVQAAAQLNGNFTIDPNGSGPKNYTSFAAAITALGAGVSGPVVFHVASTTFKEKIFINPVSGTSPNNTVTFQATGAPAVIDAGGAMDGLMLNQAVRYLVFDNLVVKNASQYVLNLYGPYNAYARFCRFVNCTFEAQATPSLSVQAAYLYFAKDCIFQNCRFMGGGRVIYSQQSERCLFDGCEIDGRGQAVHLVAPTNTNDADNLWMNCFFHDCGPGGHGVRFDSSQYGNMLWHNVVVVNTTSEAAFMGGCSPWTCCQSWRNNIIVNLGTGPAAVYGFNGTTLDCNDMDFNCYHAPHAAQGTIHLEGGAFKGSLAGWKTYLRNNPGIIPTGGGTVFDDNSIETDPGLTSMTAPFDIRLKNGSPCIDAGTALYIAGNWVSFPPPGTSLPAGVKADFEGEPRDTLPDIGADEMTVQIIASGSPKPGATLTLLLLAQRDIGLPCQVGTSLTAGSIPLGNRRIGLGLDAILIASVSGTLPTIFAGYTGIIYSTGAGQAWINIPDKAELRGVRLFNVFVTIRAGAPSGIQSISRTFVFTIN